ncbi:MAG: diguanylate cyclase, partial [Pseudomonadota bacterium]
QAADGSLWFATFTSGISHFDGQNFTNYAIGAGLDSNQIHLLRQLDDGRLLAGSYEGPLYDLSSGRPQQIEQTGLPADLALQTVRVDRDQNTWIGSYGSGLWRWTAEGHVHAFGPEQIPGSHIFDIIEDREGNLWVGTMSGLFRFRDSPFLLFGQPEGISDATFVVRQSPRSGALLVGTEMSGLFELQPDAASRGAAPVEASYSTENALSSNSVSALLIKPDGTRWIGTFGQGIDVFSSQDMSEPRRLTQQDGLASNHILALAHAPDGAIWIAAQGGLSRYIEGQITTFTEQDQLPFRLVRHLLVTDDNTLWLSSNDGLARLRDGQFSHWTSEHGLASNLITTSYLDANGTLWIGSRNGGLARLKDDTIFQFTAEHGLPRQSAMSIIEDDQNRLWISTSDGLMRVERTALEAVADGRLERVDVRLFDELDGLRSTQFVGGFAPSSWKSSDGRLWFPTNRGLVGVTPGQAQSAPQTLNLLIEAVRVNGTAMDFNPSQINQPLRLPAEARTLEIDYTAPALGVPERIAFRYQMPDLDSAWQEVGTRRTAYFTGLKPGAHEFIVEAYSLDNSFLAASATLEIDRAPLWFQQLWVRLLFTAALIALIYLAYRLIMHRSQQRQMLLEQTVEKRTQELQQALEKVQLLSRIDGLTGLFNRRFFEEKLSKEWQQTSAHNLPISVILVDIDRFKQYNDYQGHQMGDDCLREVAKCISESTLRKRDLVARYGGEEFVILLPDTDHESACLVAERLRARVAELTIAHAHSDVADYITISAGYATANGDANDDRIDNPRTLVQYADQALYRAKNRGRNRVVSNIDYD